jgi:hypothetical protein
VKAAHPGGAQTGKAPRRRLRQLRGMTMPNKKPNFVFLLCDNTGWSDFSCHQPAAGRRRQVPEHPSRYRELQRVSSSSYNEGRFRLSRETNHGRY